jgi:hypothetical protein
MRVLWSVTLAVAVASYTLFAYVTVDRRGDEAKIKSLLDRTVVAVNKRDIGGAMRCISENYKDSENLNRDRLRVLCAQAFRAEPEFSATAEVSSSSVQGTEATVALRALVKTKNQEAIYDRRLVLTLRQESARHMWLIPTKVWRVVSVDNLGLANQL